MKEYPEPNGRMIDVLELLLAAALIVALCFAVYFAGNIGRM